MELVADTNIIVAAILRAGMTRNLFFNSEIQLFTPDHTHVELLKHQAEFLEKSGLNQIAFEQASRMVLGTVDIRPYETYSALENQAKNISPDPDDWPFSAVCLQKKCALWSNEKRLKDQEKIRVYTTRELLDALK